MPANSLTPEEVAQHLNITKNTVYEMIKRGELKAYRIGRKLRIDEKEIYSYKEKKRQISMYSEKINDNAFVICGQDVILDILAKYMEAQNPGAKILRSYKGSYNGLYDLYNDKANVATAHIWDRDTDTYNSVFVKSMLPGVPAKIYPLVRRNVGFYVPTGNPKKIAGWEDFRRDDLTFINREKGSGIRVLVDERLRMMGIKPAAVKGYNSVSDSHLLAAGAIARGYADFAIGNEKAAKMADGVDFVFLHQENYDLIVKSSDLEMPLVQSLLNIIASDEYRDEVLGLGGYEL